MIDPFKITEPTCISFSGGRTSAYMLHRVLESNNGLPDEAIVCFANTGKEEEATLEFVRDCSMNWGVHIHWVEYGSRLVDFISASRKGEPFAEMIKHKSYLPNPVARFCTSDLKVKPINSIAASYFEEDFLTMVGVRADEQRRIPKLRGRGLLVPLADVGITQADVQSFWQKNKFDLGLEFMNGVTPKGNCDLCFLKGAHQIMSVIQEKPSRAEWWADMEQMIGGTFRSDRPNYAQMLKFSQQQQNLFDPQEEAISCFCGD